MNNTMNTVLDYTVEELMLMSVMLELAEEALIDHEDFNYWMNQMEEEAIADSERWDDIDWA